MSAQLMQSGWGKALLIAVGLGVAAVGGYHVYKGASKKFLKDLRISGGTGITAVGVTGYVAKGLVFAGAGLLVIVATLTGGPVEGGRTRRRGQDARSGTVRQGPADPGRARDRRVRRLQLRAQSLRPDVATAPGTTGTTRRARRAVPVTPRHRTGRAGPSAVGRCPSGPGTRPGGPGSTTGRSPWPRLSAAIPAAVSTSSAPGCAAR